MYFHLPIADLTVNMPLIFSVALFTGIIAGLLGIGGGFILTPFLMILGIPASVAVGSTGAQVFSSAFASFKRYHDNKSIDYRLCGFLSIGGILGTAIGIILFRFLTHFGYIEIILKAGFIALLAMTAFLMLVKKPSPPNVRPNLNMKHKLYFKTAKCAINIWGLIFTGGLIGIVSGLLGIGGGFLMVPALIYILKISPQSAVPASQTNIMIISSISLFLHSYFNNNVDPVLSILLVIAGAAGGMIGTFFNGQISQKTMRSIFAGIILITSSYLSYSLYLSLKNPLIISISSL